MPQGGIDKGEAPRDAALREMWEETGITSDLITIEAETEGWIPYDIPHDLVPNIWGGKYRGQEQKWFLVRYHGHDDQIDIATEHPEFSKWKWIEPSRVIDAIVPFKRATYEQVVAAFAGHLAL